MPGYYSWVVNNICFPLFGLVALRLVCKLKRGAAVFQDHVVLFLGLMHVIHELCPLFLLHLLVGKGTGGGFDW